MMTGCYNVRVGIQGALGPQSKQGINAGELTLGEVVKQRGYATAAYGKWHLGHPSEVSPHPERFRRLLRATLLERHVAVIIPPARTSRRCP